MQIGSQQEKGEAWNLYENMMWRIERRLDEVYPEAGWEAVEIELTPANGDKAFLKYTVNDSWIDEEQVRNIILEAAGSSWVSFEETERADTFLLS